MNKIQAVFESERNISHDGNSSHIIVFESGFHSGCKSRDEEIKKLLDHIVERLGEELNFVGDDSFEILKDIFKEALKDIT